MPDGLIPARRSAPFARCFAAYARRLLRRRFAAVRLAHGTRDVLARAAAHSGPVMIAMTHPAWWDPLVALVLTEALLPGRTPCAPIDLAQFHRFRFMRRLGLFGLDPRHPDALRLMTEHVAERFARDRSPVLVVTPQGAFTDVRVPLRLRPGAAAVAAAHPSLHVVVLALEYPFWQDARPEVLVRAATCGRPGSDRAATSRAAWQRALTVAMQADADALASLAIARDAGAFEPLLAARSRIHPVYDVLQRLRGAGVAILPRAQRDGRR